MEDFYYAGGLPAVLNEMKHLLHTDALTVNGKTIGENSNDAPCYNRDVIKTIADPVLSHAGLLIRAAHSTR